MQILGKRSKILLIAAAIAMLTALGLSFALWDTEAVKASSGNVSTYANAKIGDILKFGQYYQTGNKDKNDTTEYEKTPIEWIVVDKDERSGEVTLMSKYVLACGSFFGNSYINSAGESGGWYDNHETVGKIPYNQAYVDSTARAFLNNLERFDLGGDGFTSGIGYVPSMHNSDKAAGVLRSSVGFSNKRYSTGLKYDTPQDYDLVNAGGKGLYKRSDNNDIYYQRPIKNVEYKNRPATRGFYDEAFSEEEKSIIEPKHIAGYTGHRWPDEADDISIKRYIEGSYDKVWLPSASELNIMKGFDWHGDSNDSWTNPSDEIGSEVFEYFYNYSKYGFQSVSEALKTARTNFAKNGFAMNYSIPVYNRLSEGATELTVNTDIKAERNSLDYYWTRSAPSLWYYYVRVVGGSGNFNGWHTLFSNLGVRPCVILKY